MAETIEELKARLEKAEADIVVAKKAQSGVDKSYAAAAARVKELEARILAGGEKADLVARLDRVEKAYKEKEASLSLKYYAKTKALDAGIEYGLIEDFDFKDEAQVDAKIHALASFTEGVKEREANRALLSMEKPRAGTGSAAPPVDPRITQALAGLNR